MKAKWTELQQRLTGWVDRYWGALRLAALAVWVLGGVVVIFGVININLDTQELSAENVKNGQNIEALLQRSLEQGARIEELVGFVNTVQSPETEAAQRDLLNDVLAIARCDSRESAQAVIDALVDAGLVSEREVQCPVHPGRLEPGD